ncbi:MULTISPECIES: hypothetical protein [unclassified Pseudovibrio]|uniref:hypothetical protein n=1 Tax=unclassified Pseudovibrio TaxID=2627060 RepID=UPI0007AEA601|nr:MULTISPECIES: hypothetical protein [unclassified Pseudovibrio]KZK95065.1 hypothetical protein PsW74_04327 [Pseudovibrio sp. W74]KZL08867.1 hypothetical protein PsAD14_02812 [Pseudovibrio sp. Ad14]
MSDYYDQPEGQSLSLKHAGKTYIAWSEADLKAAGVPQVAIDGAHKDARLTTIKAECRKRIYARASAETQMNMATAGAAIAGKAEADRSQDEKAVLVGIKAALDWVGAMRSKCLELAEDPASDFTQDASWPECPPEVVALTEQF